jgi:fibrillarin-like pre-rRNA processing protein
VFDDALDSLREGYEILDTERLDPLHDDHLAGVARPRED